MFKSLQTATRRRHTIRTAVIGAALAGAMFVGLASPAPAGAAVNATVETVSSTISCNSSTRVMTLGASITLNGAYLNGAYVAYRFRYFQVNSAGAQITPFYGGNWSGPTFVKTWSQSTNLLGGVVFINNPVHLSGGSVTWAGRLRAQIEIAVWTGSGYVYTGWLDPASYTNYYPTSVGMEVTTLSNCLTAW